MSYPFSIAWNHEPGRLIIFVFSQLILAVGTKLQAILTRMALEISERHAVIQGIPLVQGSDKYFWFGKPQLVLHLIHFALFQVLYFTSIQMLKTFHSCSLLQMLNIFSSSLQNSFQIIYFLWIWVKKKYCFLSYKNLSNSLSFAMLLNLLEIISYLQYEFGLKSCFHNNFELVIVKLALG